MAWVWGCMWENGAGYCSKDSENCRVCSRKMYKTKKLAEQAAKKHKHPEHITVWYVHGNVKW